MPRIFNEQDKNLKFRRELESMIEGQPDYIVKFRNHLESEGVNIKTIHAYIRMIIFFFGFIHDKYGDIDPMDITDEEIESFMTYTKTNHGNGRDGRTSELTRATNWTVLNKYFEYLYRRSSSPSPMRLVKRPSTKVAKGNIKRIAMTHEELTEVVDTVKSGVGSEHARRIQAKWFERDILIMLLLINTGMRADEVRGINIEDIDDETQTLTVIGKRGKRHEYPLTESTMEHYHKWMDKRTVFMQGRSDDHALFISMQRKRMSYDSIRNLSLKYANGLSPHKFRSSYCTNLLEATGDIKFVADCVGHEDISTTQLYTVTDRVKSRRKANQLISVDA